MGEVTAALITGREAVEFRTFPAAPPGPGCVTVEIALCGVCGTDIASYRTGHLHSPAVCGHEWVGVVRDVATGVDGVAEGQRVVVAVPPACGACPECRGGAARDRRAASSPARGRGPLGPPHGGLAPPGTRAPRAGPPAPPG